MTKRLKTQIDAWLKQVEKDAEKCDQDTSDHPIFDCPTCKFNKKGAALIKSLLKELNDRE